MSSKYKDICFKEPDLDIYRKIKSTELLSSRELEFLAYIGRLQPCSVHSVLEIIAKENSKYSQSKVVGFNKITKPFKNLKIIKVTGYEKPLKGRKREVIELTGQMPVVPVKKSRVDKKLQRMISSSIESALLAVEVYNKPRVSFRVESYYTLMNIAWTKIMHAYYKKNEGEVYYKKDKNNKYIIIDDEKQTWSLLECVKLHPSLTDAVKDNLKLAVGLRNKIVHSYVDSTYLEGKICGQSQALLHNYETFLKTFFLGEYIFDANIHFSLQISTELLKEQENSIRSRLSTEVRNIVTYIDKYNSAINQHSFDSSEYSYRIALRPIVSNSGRNADISVVFDKSVSFDEVEKVSVVDRVKTIEVANAGKHLPSSIVKLVRKNIPGFNMQHHTALFNIFNIRPSGRPEKMLLQDATRTDKRFCHYDEPVKTFIYTNEWTDFIVSVISYKKLTLEMIMKYKKENKSLKVKDFI